MTTRYVDPVLVAVSDCLVLTALERGWSRTVLRSDRAKVPSNQKHQGYLRFPIHMDKIDKALTDAWQLCALMAHRHDLDIPWKDWAAVLDGYTRAIVTALEPHSIERLAEFLAPLGSATVEVREFLAVS